MKLLIKVIPNSSKNEIAETMSNGVVKIRITSAPVDNKANITLIKLLSKKYNIPKNNIKIVKGLKKRNKIIKLDICY